MTGPMASERLDVWLNRVQLMKSRSMAAEACRRGKVMVNGEAAKASRSISPGAMIAMDLGRGVREVEVLSVPSGNVSKATASRHYRDATIDDPAEPWI